MIRVNQLLRRAQDEAHRDLRFVQASIVQYQEDHRQLDAQNHQLRRAILTMTAVGACTAATPASDTFQTASNPQSAEACIQQATSVHGALPSSLKRSIKMVPCQKFPWCPELSLTNTLWGGLLCSMSCKDCDPKRHCFCLHVTAASCALCSCVNICSASSDRCDF